MGLCNLITNKSNLLTFEIQKKITAMNEKLLLTLGLYSKNIYQGASLFQAP